MPVAGPFGFVYSIDAWWLPSAKQPFMTEDQSTPDQPSTGVGQLRRAMALLLVVAFVSLIAMRGAFLWWRYDEIITDSQRQAERLALVLSKHFEQTVAGIDTALAQLALHGQRVGGANAQPPFWRPVLDASLAGLSGVGSVSILNEEGLIAHSTIPAIVGQSRADQFVFRHLSSVASDDLVADTPYRSITDGRPLIPFGRRLTTSAGIFDGVVVATLDPSQLRGLYRSVDVGEHGVISVLHPTGLVLFREPSKGDPIGSSAEDNPLFEILQSNEVGSGFLRSPLTEGGSMHLTAYHILAKPNALLAVSLSEDDVLRHWRNELWGSAIGVGAIGLLLMIAGLLIDREIRARAAADTALRENRERLNEILDRAPIVVSVKDTAGKLIFINRALEKLLGISRTEAKGKELREFAADHVASLIRELDKEVIESKAALQREVSYSVDDGKRSVLFVKFPLLDRRGAVESVVSFSLDLTDQRRAETWFKAIMDHAPASVVLKDMNGRYLYTNRALEKWIGVRASELVGKSTDDLFDPEYAKLHNDLDHEVAETKTPQQREFLAPFSSEQRSVLFTKFPIFDADGKLEGIGSIGTDITDRKRVEMQLAHSQRLDAVGKLTGGIAHDFNNLLTVIIGNSELLAAALADNARLHPLAQVTLDAAERSAALTQRLLAFGRRQMLEPKQININELLESMRDLLERAVGEQVTVKYWLRQDLWPATIDPGQLETAVLNLVINARDAMPKGGRIVIETSNSTLDEGYAEENPEVRPGEYVSIAVSDTGTGMPPEVVARVFEPFFTTKEVGKGTGLGLPTIYGFIKQSGGHVKIYSEVGHGTVVRLYIPRSDAPSLVPGMQPEAFEELPHGHESILLVEDNPLVRTHTENQLRDLGYEVVCATGPAEAVKLAEQMGKPDLLLTDVIMPGGENGRELAARMRERWPDLRVLCTSGYTDGAMPELTEGLHFLAKPFRRKDLALKVRAALDTPVPVQGLPTA